MLLLRATVEWDGSPMCPKLRAKRDRAVVNGNAKVRRRREALLSVQSEVVLSRAVLGGGALVVEIDV